MFFPFWCVVPRKIWQPCCQTVFTLDASLLEVILGKGRQRTAKEADIMDIIGNNCP
jgi:hypothetical protein